VTLTWRAVLQSVQLLLGQTQYSDFKVPSLKYVYSRKFLGHFMIKRVMLILLKITASQPKEQNLPEHLIVFQLMENLVDLYGIRKLIPVFAKTNFK